MKYTQDLADVLKTALDANKRISRIDELLSDVEGFLFNVDVLNSLERNATMNVDGTPLSDIPFPAAFASMIYPNSVTVNGKEQDVDFLARPKMAITDEELKKKIWNRGKWMDFTSRLYNSRRASEHEWVAVSELRKNELMANVSDISAFNVGTDEKPNEVCSFACEERFPIPLAIQVKKSAFYSQYTVGMAQDYIFRNMLVGISKK